jgi:hypothetical protein
VWRTQHDKSSHAAGVDPELLIQDIDSNPLCRHLEKANANVRATNQVSKKSLWAGRINSAPDFFPLMDGVMKLVKLAPVVEATVRLGFPESTIVGRGCPVGLHCLYLIRAAFWSDLPDWLSGWCRGNSRARRRRVVSVLFR